jgi:hypothetical protein
MPPARDNSHSFSLGKGDPITALGPLRPPETTVSQADTDSQLLELLWLHGRGEATRRAYERDSGRFLAFKLADMHAHADGLDELAPATQSRAIVMVKSLFGFAHRLGYALQRRRPGQGTVGEGRTV